MKKNKDKSAPSLLPVEYYRNIILHEFNLLRHPVFFTNAKFEGKQKMIDIRFTNEYGEGYWIVSPSMLHGSGGPFEDLTLMILNKIITELPRPVTNPINIGPLSRILTLMDYDESKGSKGGWPYERLKTAIRRMVSISIMSKFAFFDKDQGRYLADRDGTFHILDQCLFVGEVDNDGNKAESNFIWLNETLLKSINRRYVGPIDLDFYTNLKPMARALFKLLQVVFFAIKGTPLPATFRYSTICDRTTITRQAKIAQAKQVLLPAHEDLLSKGFLKAYQWVQIPGEKNDWKIRYWPGELADKFSTLHVPVKGVHWLTDAETLTPTIKHIETEVNPSLFDMLGSGAQPPEEEGETQQANNKIDNKEHETNIEHYLEFYVTEFQKYHGNKPLINKSRDHAIIQELISNGCTKKDIESLLRLFLMEKENAYVIKAGYTLPVFKTVLNALMVQLGKKRKSQKESAAKSSQSDTIDNQKPWEDISIEDIRKVKDNI